MNAWRETRERVGRLCTVHRPLAVRESNELRTQAGAHRDGCWGPGSWPLLAVVPRARGPSLPGPGLTSSLPHATRSAGRTRTQNSTQLAPHPYSLCNCPKIALQRGAVRYGRGTRYAVWSSASSGGILGRILQLITVTRCGHEGSKPNLHAHAHRVQWQDRSCVRAFVCSDSRPNGLAYRGP